MAVKQTAGHDQLGAFAPKFAELNDDVLFGEVWSREAQLPLRDRSLVTVVALMAQGLVDSSFEYHLATAKANGITKAEIAEILTHAAFYVGWPKAWAAFRLATKVWAEQEAPADEEAGNGKGDSRKTADRKTADETTSRMAGNRKGNGSKHDDRADGSERNRGPEEETVNSESADCGTAGKTGVARGASGDADDERAAYERTLPFPLGEPNDAYAQFFDGQSYLAPVSVEQVPFVNVTFEPGCRNHWHIHHATSGGGQMLVCVGGHGWYQEWGKPARALEPGDVVHIPAETKHWHGAAANSWFSHLAFEVPGENTSNEWCEPVDPEAYEKLHR